jgi:phosphoglycolate phosphatase-like HAD superfamily hydrolase
VLIADSPNDVRAAQIANARTIAVATGNATQAELRNAGADVVLPTLSDTDRVVRAVQSLTGEESL